MKNYRITQMLVISILAVAPRCSLGQVLYVTYYDATQYSAIGTFSAVTGSVIRPNLVQQYTFGGLQNMVLDSSGHLFVNENGNSVLQFDATSTSLPLPLIGVIPNNNSLRGLAVDTNHHLFVSSFLMDEPTARTESFVTKYDANTLQNLGTFIATPLTRGVTASFTGVLCDGQNHLFVGDTAAGATIGKYDLTTGQRDSSFAGTLGGGEMALDSLNHLLVSYDSTNTIAEYDATTGNVINGTFITGLHSPVGIALDDNNHLFVVNNGTGGYFTGTVGEYDATTGATINANFITNLTAPGGIVFVAPIPEPSSLLLIAAAATAAGVWRRRASFVAR